MRRTVSIGKQDFEEKDYDEELIKRGLKKENIYYYAFAFRGKEVLIESGCRI